MQNKYIKGSIPSENNKDISSYTVLVSSKASVVTHDFLFVLN